MTSDNKSKYQVHLPSGRWLLSPPRIYAKTSANSPTTSSPLNPTMNFIQKYQPWFSSGHKTFLCDASKFWGQIKPQLNLFRHHNIMFQASSNDWRIPKKSGHIRNFFTGLRTFRPDQRMHLFLLFFWTTALKADSEESKSVGTKPYSGEQSCDIWTMLQKSSF